MSLIALLPEDERQEALQRILYDEKSKFIFHHGWGAKARAEQKPPRDRSWIVWLLLAGRGFGKTRTGAETVLAEVKARRAKRIALVAPTAADARDVMVEGESGILAVAAPDNRPAYERSKHRLTWKNGAIATCYSADEPRRLRGPQHDFAWIRAQDTSGNFSAYLGPVSSTTLGVDAADITGQLVAAQIAANSIAASNLINGLDVVQVVALIGSAVPATSNVAYEASTAKLYRWNGSAWIANVASTDITGTLTTAQIGSIAAAQLTGQIMTTQIANNAITTPLISAGAVVSASIAAGTIVANNIAANTITAIQIQANTITAAQIAAGTITANQIATGTITAAQIHAGGITGTNIAGSTITGTNIAGLTITAANLAAGTITGDKITANFFQGNSFTATSGAGSSIIQMYGGNFVSGGLSFGPYFAATDTLGNPRVVIGLWSGQYGLHVWNSAGVEVFSAGDLGVSIIGTGNVKANNITFPYGVIVPGGATLLWSHNADVTGVIGLTASLLITEAGGGTAAGALQLIINGGLVAQQQVFLNNFGSMTATIAYGAFVGAGQNITVAFATSFGSITFGGGSVGATIYQR
jgi:hypothetical protein